MTGTVDRHLVRRGALLLLILLAFGIRLSGLTAQSFWRDEVDALRFSAVPLASLLSGFTRPGWNGPLFYVWLRLWIVLVGRSEFAVRYLSLLLGVLGTALLYRLGREWFAPRVGALAALLTASSPYMVWYAQEGKMYALLCALAIGTLLVYQRAVSSGHTHLWIAMVLLAWGTAAVHIVGALIIPLMAALLAVWWPIARRHWRKACLALAASILPGFVVLPWIVPYLLRGADIGHRFVPLLGIVVTMLYAFGRGISTAGGLWPIGLALFGLLAGTMLWSGTSLFSWPQPRPQDRKSPGSGSSERSSVLAAWTWFLLPILGLYLVTLRVPMFVDRYLIWIGPAFYLLLARGFDQLWRQSSYLSGICLAAMLALNCWGVWAQSVEPLKSDFRTAAAHVRQHRLPGELILFHISYVRQTFEYYYGDSSPAADGVATDERTTPEAVDAAMRQRLAGYDVVWLVLSEPEMWDQRGMTVAWLDAHGTLLMRADLARVSVVQYRIVRDLP